MHGVEARAAEAAAAQRAWDGSGGRPAGLGVWVKLLRQWRWQLGRLGLRTGEKGAWQSRPQRGCLLGFVPWPLKGIGRLHHIQIFL
jgi:hypothetical protein